jgi:hypothetical protein
MTNTGLITANGGLTVSGTGTANLLKFGTQGLSGCFIQAGSFSTTVTSLAGGAGQNMTAVVYSTSGVAFTNTPYVILTMNTNNQGGSGKLITSLLLSSNTGFTGILYNPSSSTTITTTVIINWIAIGN